MSIRLRDFLRDLFKAIAVYAAGAWIAIEVVDFAVQQYGLSHFLVDAAVVIAFGGGIVTAVVAWFHGESGRQSISVSEIVIISSIVIATGISVYLLKGSNGLDAFNQLEGYRLVLEYRDTDLENTDGHQFRLTPMEAIEFIDGGDRGIFSLTPGKGDIRGPFMKGQFEGHPTMFFDAPDSDFVQIIFVLPYEPTDVSDLIAIGTIHDGALINTEGLSLHIDSSITVMERKDGATIRINEIGLID